MKKSEQPNLIILIDDDEEDYILLKIMLNKTFGTRVKLDWYQRDTVADEIICENPYILSLIDYRVGFENGIEIIKKVKEKCSEKAVFLYTDWGDSKVLEEALVAGAAGVIKKSSLCPEIIHQYIEPYLI